MNFWHKYIINWGYYLIGLLIGIASQYTTPFSDKGFYIHLFGIAAVQILTLIELKK